MFIDLRTHMIALVAVFLALGIGILIGVDMIGGQGLVNQERALAAHLELDFQNLRNQNNALAAQLNNEQRAMTVEETFANQAAAALVAGETTGVAVSHIPQMEALGVTTVDDLDLTPGLVATVLGLDGAKGNYGVKATAERLMPVLPAPAH
jgi:hypothetical protein